MRGDARSISRRTARRATGVTYVDRQRRGIGAAGRPRAALRLQPVQRAAAAAVGHRQALRSARRTRAWSAATTPTRPAPASTSSSRTSHSIRSSAPARSARRSTTSTATISTTARLASSAAAIDRLRLHQRPADRVSPDAARHADLGQQVEEGRQRELSARRQRRRARQRDELPRQLSRPRSDLQGSARPAAAAHDLRLPRQRAEDVELLTDAATRSPRRWARRRRQVNRAHRPWTVVPYQTTHNTGGAIMGERPEDQRGQPLSAVLGRAERVRDGRVSCSRRTPATTRPARSAR